MLEKTKTLRACLNDKLMYFSQGQSWLEKQKSVEIAHVVWYKINMDIKISALSDTNKRDRCIFFVWANITEQTYWLIPGMKALHVKTKVFVHNTLFLWKT